MIREARNIEIEIVLGEMAAIGIEVDGYNAENAHRISCDNSVAYGSDAYFEAAERMRECVKRLEEIRDEFELEAATDGKYLL